MFILVVQWRHFTYASAYKLLLLPSNRSKLIPKTFLCYSQLWNASTDGVWQIDLNISWAHTVPGRPGSIRRTLPGLWERKRLWKQEAIKYQLSFFSRNTKRQVLYSAKLTLPISYMMILLICNSGWSVDPSEMCLPSRRDLLQCRVLAIGAFLMSQRGLKHLPVEWKHQPGVRGHLMAPVFLFKYIQDLTMHPF